MPAVDTLRLNPLAFPRNPYHHLVKHYQDGQLKRGRLNDPELDARLTLDLFHDQWRTLAAVVQEAPDLIAAWHWLTTGEAERSGFNTFFSSLRGALRPSDEQARKAIAARLAGIACRTHAREVLAEPGRHGWPLAYALAWLSVSEGNSVMPPWVRHEFPQAGLLVRRLRDTACNDPHCDWCRERHDARKELGRWFGFEDFRPEPLDHDTRQPMQRSIVEAAMAGRRVLGTLPTGTGKSLCYQIPALSRYDKTGALTVVVSPLVALMADQVAGLEARGIVACIAINGLLSLPERSNALDRVRLGDAGILIISPEQLRNRSLRRVLGQREIGAWVGATYCSSHTGPAPTDIVSVPLAEQSGTIRLVSHLDEPPNGRSGVDGTRFLSGWLQQSTSGYSEHQHGRRKASKGFSLLAHRFRTPDVRLAKHPKAILRGHLRHAESDARGKCGRFQRARVELAERGFCALRPVRWSERRSPDRKGPVVGVPRPSAE